MSKSEELRQLADKFSEGWHEGIKIDAMDVMLLSDVASELETMQAILTQQPDNTACRSVRKRLMAQQPATGEPGAWSEREQLRHAQAAVVMPMIGPLLDAWENSDREVMSQEPELSKQLKNINSAMEDADTPQAPSVLAASHDYQTNWLG